MLMDQETIVTLYREAVDNGDPKEIINSMAKTNGCSPGEIRQILNDAGEFVPRQKRGRPKAAAAEKERARAEETADIVINQIEREKKRVANMSAPPNVKCAGIPEEVWEDPAAGEEQEKRMAEEPQTAKVEINIFLKEIMRRGIKDLKKELEEKRHKVADLKSDLDQLKRWHESEAQELERLEKSYAWALAEYAGIIFKEGIDFENAQGPDAGQLAEQRSGD